jgi:thiamine-monophosphate kinase
MSSDLLHICECSGCGCRVLEKNIPIDYQTAVMAEELNMNVTTCALNGGEDYELLFTVSQKDYDKIKNLQEIHIIGHVTEQGMPAVMVTPQNTTITLRAQAFQGLDE